MPVSADRSLMGRAFRRVGRRVRPGARRDANQLRSWWGSASVKQAIRKAPEWSTRMEGPRCRPVAVILSGGAGRPHRRAQGLRRAWRPPLARPCHRTDFGPQVVALAINAAPDPAFEVFRIAAPAGCRAGSRPVGGILTALDWAQGMGEAAGPDGGGRHAVSAGRPRGAPCHVRGPAAYAERP
jgi:hypothetical protein